MFGSKFARAQQRHDGLVDQEWAELFHEVQRQAGPLVGGRVCDAKGTVRARLRAARRRIRTGGWRTRRTGQRWAGRGVSVGCTHRR